MSGHGETILAPVAQRPLGGTGRQVSELGLGCASYWARPGFAESRARAVFDAALACGITLFDTGGSYAGGEAERRLGRMIRASGADPDKLVIATKAGTRSDRNGRIVRDFSPSGVVEQVDQSLERLGLERLALLQLHGPAPAELTDELLTALERLRTAGKLQLLGVNAHADALEHAVGRAPFDVLMPFVSVVKAHNAGLARRASDAGQGVLAAEPLARMRFAPPLARWLTSGSGLWYLARALSQSDGQLIARRRRCLRKALAAPGWSRAQLALGWVLGQPGISSAVFGTTRPEHVRELALACTRPVPETVVDAIAACCREGPGHPE
ncbi:MAG TPA: aldo/keto reductase [Wenzhouxiangellaceae bacterium]|nr:aldo/keto reductase [Wenzhouxiangellaceae bacterium]